MAERGVGQTELLADRHREHSDDIPVDEIEDVGEQQKQKHARPKGAVVSRRLGHYGRRSHGGGEATSPAASPVDQ